MHGAQHLRIRPRDSGDLNCGAKAHMIRTSVVQVFGSRVCQSEAPINNAGLLGYKHNKLCWVFMGWQPCNRASWMSGSFITLSYGRLRPETGLLSAGIRIQALPHGGLLHPEERCSEHGVVDT